MMLTSPSYWKERCPWLCLSCHWYLWVRGWATTSFVGSLSFFWVFLWRLCSLALRGLGAASPDNVSGPQLQRVIVINKLRKDLIRYLLIFPSPFPPLSALLPPSDLHENLDPLPLTLFFIFLSLSTAFLVFSSAWSLNSLIFCSVLTSYFFAFVSQLSNWCYF